MGTRPTDPILHAQTINRRPLLAMHINTLVEAFKKGLGNRDPIHMITVIGCWSSFDPETLSSSLDPALLKEARFITEEKDLAHPLTILNGNHRRQSLRSYLAPAIENVERFQALAKQTNNTSADAIRKGDLIRSKLAEAETLLEKRGSWIVRVVDAGKFKSNKRFCANLFNLYLFRLVPFSCRSCQAYASSIGL